MTLPHAPAAPAQNVGLLKHALDYALAAAQHIAPHSLDRPTPCDRWSLGMLLRHVNESLDVLDEGLTAGRVGVVAPPAAPSPEADLLFGFRSRACRLLRNCVTTRVQDEVIVAGRPLPLWMVAGTGALEIAVHGWDIAQACGHPYPVPAGLAENLLALAPLVINDATRHALFAPPVPVPPSGASEGDRLVARLGRTPLPRGGSDGDRRAGTGHN
ncbi:TIGR03086 family metal-binding protein [Spirillospora sp. CA-255316]